MRQTLHFGVNAQFDWGCIPVVVLLGDDCQLPSIKIGVMECTNEKFIGQSTFIARGLKLLKKLHIFI